MKCTYFSMIFKFFETHMYWNSYLQLDDSQQVLLSSLENGAAFTNADGIRLPSAVSVVKHFRRCLLHCHVLPQSGLQIRIQECHLCEMIISVATWGAAAFWWISDKPAQETIPPSVLAWWRLLVNYKCSAYGGNVARSGVFHQRLCNGREKGGCRGGVQAIDMQGCV